MIPPVTIAIRRLRPERDADIPLPKTMSPHAAGMDIHAAIEKKQIIQPGKILLVPTGFAMAIPDGYEVQVRPRSGLAAKHGIGLINSPGTIDSDYRGEIMVPLINLGDNPFTLQRKDRIAQMVLQKVYPVIFQIVDRLDDTQRSSGGFGHTGV